MKSQVIRCKLLDEITLSYHLSSLTSLLGHWHAVYISSAHSGLVSAMQSEFSDLETFPRLLLDEKNCLSFLSLSRHTKDLAY